MIKLATNLDQLTKASEMGQRHSTAARFGRGMLVGAGPGLLAGLLAGGVGGAALGPLGLAVGTGVGALGGAGIGALGGGAINAMFGEEDNDLLDRGIERDKMLSNPRAYAKAVIELERRKAQGKQKG